VDAPLGRPPVFVRAGAALVLARGDIPQLRPHDVPPRLLYAVPSLENGRGSSPHFEDDGESWSLRSGDFVSCDVELAWTRDTIDVSVRRTGGARRPPDASEFEIVCPTAGGRKTG
jgi:alpha-glucosidase (family GH31 glycosyl hydrolase)